MFKASISVSVYDYVQQSGSEKKDALVPMVLVILVKNINGSLNFSYNSSQGQLLSKEISSALSMWAI